MSELKWRRTDAGDWRYERLTEGEEPLLLGAVVYQDWSGRRQWHTVASALSHGPEEASGLTAAKRRIEQLWRDAAAAAETPDVGGEKNSPSTS